MKMKRKFLLSFFIITISIFAFGLINVSAESIADFDSMQEIICIVHRGDWHSYPENSAEAVKAGFDYSAVSVDLKVTKDNKVVLCHDKYFTWQETTRPDGTFITKEEPRTYLWHLTYDEIKKYDVGQRQHPNYPEQVTMPAVRPLLSDVLTFTENYAKEKGLAPLKYNIEIKADPDMTEEEKELFNYYHFTKGEQAASEYFEKLTDSLEKRKTRNFKTCKRNS